MSVVLQGHVYYRLIDDSRGEIKAISFTPLDDSQVEGLSLALLEVNCVLPYTGSGADLSNLILSIADDGIAKIDENTKPRNDRVDANPLIPIYRQIHGDLFAVTIDTNGGAIVLPISDTSAISLSTPIHLWITKLDEPNVLLTSYSFTPKQVISGEYIIADLPSGDPNGDYSFFYSSSDPKLTMGWTFT